MGSISTDSEGPRDDTTLLLGLRVKSCHSLVRSGRRTLHQTQKDFQVSRMSKGHKVVIDRNPPAKCEPWMVSTGLTASMQRCEMRRLTKLLLHGNKTPEAFEKTGPLPVQQLVAQGSPAAEHREQVAASSRNSEHSMLQRRITCHRSGTKSGSEHLNYSSSKQG